MSVKLYCDGEEVEISCWKFPAGEVGVKVVGVVPAAVVAGVVLKWESNNDLLLLLQLNDIIDHYIKPAVKQLYIPYFPYSRQDRRCFQGESHSLKVVGNLINGMSFDCVTTEDAHSTVLDAVVNNLHNVPQEVCAVDLPKFDVIVAPDAGAAKKIFFHNQVVNGDTQVVIANKVRGEKGLLLSVELSGNVDISGKNICVVDDLCDGGATFIELGKVLHKHSPASMSLYVTHGLFTKGVDQLLGGCYSNIYVHNLVNKYVQHQIKEI